MTPHFICIGAQKAGTTWLYDKIRHHPGVWMPPYKEIHYFDAVHGPEKHILRLQTKNRLSEIQKGTKECRKKIKIYGRPYIDAILNVADLNDEWYQRIFAHKDARNRCAGDVTPAYAVLPSAGVEHMRRLCPDARLIHLVRDPVSRALSNLRMAAQRGRLSMDSPEAVLGSRQYERATARSRYSEILPRWEAIFPPAQILYLPFNLIAKAPDEAMRRVEAHLDLPPHGYRDLHEARHPTKAIAVPAAVRDALEENLAPERAYLDARFGAGFG